MRRPESLLVTRVANYLKCNHPAIPYRFDQIDQVTRQAGKRNKEIHGRWSRGFPDLTIFARKRPLMLELKATATVPNTEHTRRQAAYHQVLRDLGYKVKFVCGYDEAICAIDKHLVKYGHEINS